MFRKVPSAFRTTASSGARSCGDTVLGAKLDPLLVNLALLLNTALLMANGEMFITDALRTGVVCQLRGTLAALQSLAVSSQRRKCGTFS